MPMAASICAQSIAVTAGNADNNRSIRARAVTSISFHHFPGSLNVCLFSLRLGGQRLGGKFSN